MRCSKFVSLRLRPNAEMFVKHLSAYTRQPAFKEIQVAQLSQRDRAAGWVSYGQKWKTKARRQYFTDNIGLSSFFNHCDVIGQQSNRIR